MPTIEDFRTAVNNKLDELAATLGETTALDKNATNTVSYGIDNANETLNPDLPPRPHA